LPFSRPNASLKRDRDDRVRHPDSAVKQAFNFDSAIAIVAGGFLAGLAADLELRAAGFQVSIHERSDRVLDDRGAGNRDAAGYFADLDRTLRFKRR
jgi:NADPH-dependent 2,4-dienoyl-CoA reductase/sulfur reductase-like enzyme